MKEVLCKYPPTYDEAVRVMRHQALVIFEFHSHPSMTVAEYSDNLTAALAPLKQNDGVEKYSLGELKKVAHMSSHIKYKRLYEHESRHAQQIENAMAAMGYPQKLQFIVYYCPILADMYSAGRGVGLLELRGVWNFTREQMVEFDRRVALQMLKTLDNSLGDLYILSAIAAGSVAELFALH